MQVRRWLPDQPTRIGRHDWPDEGDNGTHMRLRAGSIVVLDRQAWRILEINGYTGDRWPDSYEKAWRDHVELWWHANELRRANNQAVKPAPERAEFYKRPVVLVLRNENLPRSTPKHWCAPASHDWQVLPEHYAVCRACGELPPCRHGEYRWEGGPRWPEQNGGIPLMVPEGCCMGCAEPIGPRMRTVRFPGPNLWYPDLGEDTAVFHARTACADQVDCYRMQWQTEYHPRSSTHSATLAFPGFEHFVLPRTRNAPDLTPHVQPTGAAPAGPPSPAAPEPAHQPAPAAPTAPTAPTASGAPGAPVADPVVPVRPATPGPAPAAEAPATAPPHPVEGAGMALRAAEELGLTLAERPAFHNAEQAARVIEELTAAVRNIALCLNDPAARARS
ncbi:hypothetical protein [Streptomyces roseolilacinus]|uniref:Uncharacterized protein n=1 Tax=Streptomyces roseolilacinus TaxID=66904 RepID=A0A918B0U4_9ACTN|nr:hypothetical protein [Streptomyces roseolilacinus]GGQ12241.1 hypothetical protein GCM10010249_33610 [Streptomyces roseolilacinus]